MPASFQKRAYHYNIYLKENNLTCPTKPAIPLLQRKSSLIYSIGSNVEMLV